MGTKVLFVDPEKCVGCMSCVMACSLEHGDVIGPWHSRILPVRLRKQVLDIPVVCRQCAKPLCADACPMGAITRDEQTGAMVVDRDLCIACGMCMVACPLGGVVVNKGLGHSVKCDLCGGDPMCAKFCGYGAVEYIPEEEAAWRRKKEAVGKLANMLEVLTTHSK
jgi:anaerobic carbon-monoxide dehydrogenase iron sulfur subunit